MPPVGAMTLLDKEWHKCAGPCGLTSDKIDQYHIYHTFLQ